MTHSETRRNELIRKTQYWQYEQHFISPNFTCITPLLAKKKKIQINNNEIINSDF